MKSTSKGDGVISPRFTVRSRLLLLVLVATLPLMALTLYTGIEQRASAEREAQAEGLRLAQLAADEQGHQIIQTEQLLSLLARLPEVQTQNAARCNTLFADVLEQFPAYANLGVADLEGNVVCSALPLPGPVKVADRPYFQRAVQSRAFAVGEYQVGRISGLPSLNFGYPVMDPSGDVQAVVFAAMDLDWISRFVDTVSLPDSSTLTVIDQTGLILASSLDAERSVGSTPPDTSIVEIILTEKEGLAEAEGSDGVMRLYSFIPIEVGPEGGEVYVYIGTPTRIAYAEADRTLARNLVITGLVMLVVMGMALNSSQRFVQKGIAPLVQAAQLLRRGDLTARVGYLSPLLELNVLATTFNEMAISLEMTMAERDRSAQALRRINRAYRVLSDCNQALVRATAEDELLSEICQILVDRGGYRLAWVGFSADDDQKSVRPIAQTGTDQSFLTMLNLSWADTERGRGPTGTAIRTGQPVVFQDALVDSRFAPWREQAIQHGYTSLLAIPLQDGRTHAFGALTVCAVEADAFDDQETALLQELAADLAFGILALRGLDEREHMQRALWEGERRYRALFEGSNDAIFILDLEGVHVTANQRAAELLGYEVDELIGMSFKQVTVPEQHSDAKSKLEALQAGTVLPIYERTFQRKDGSTLPVEISLSLVRDQAGYPQHIQSVVRDLSEHQRTEEALRQSEASFRLMFTANPQPMWVYEAETLQFLEVNQAAIEHYGYSRDEFLAMTIADIRPPDDVQLLHNYISAGLSSLQQSGEWRHRRKSGDLMDVEIVTHELDFAGRRGRLVVAHDVTERNRVQASLQQALADLAQHHERLSALYRISQLVNSSLQVSTILDHLADEAMRVTRATHGQILIANSVERRFERHALRGFSPEEALLAKQTPLSLDQGINSRVYKTGQNVRVDDVLAEPEYFGLIPATRSELAIPIVRDGRVIGNFDLQSPEPAGFTEADTAYLAALAEQAALAIENAHLYEELETYSSLLQQAVTERTEDLKRVKDRAEGILHAVGEGLMVVTPDGRIRQVNPAFEQQTGYTSDEVALRHHAELLLAAEMSPELLKSLTSAMRAGQPWQGEMPVRRKDGSAYDGAVTISPLRSSQGQVTAFVGSIRDITALKEVQRLKDEFVSNVSHELRTPITSIKLSHHLLTKNPAKGSIYLERLGREVDRLNLLIEDLLRLSRLDQGRVELHLTAVDLRSLAAQYVEDRKLLAESRGLHLEMEPTSPIGVVSADEGLIGQALSVLLTNALNYTPVGGSVTLGTCLEHREQGAWVGLRVKDTGPGIASAEHPQLFQRFFRGRAGRESGTPGTGLGLAIVKEIVNRHGGRVDVYSDGIPGQGATFTIWIPSEN